LYLLDIFRFLGSCVEDFAQAHNAHMLDNEHKANEISTYSALLDEASGSSLVSDDQSTIRTLNIYIALLHSCNTRCANSIFKTISNVWDRLNVELSTSGLLNSLTGRQIVDDVILLITMSVLHPAFVFNQRIILNEMLTHSKRLLSGLQVSILLIPWVHGSWTMVSVARRETFGDNFVMKF